MGKPSADQPTSITHFSHPHPLHLLNPQTLILHCSACMLDASASSAVHACINCNFALHPKCTQLPHQITHPFHEKHSLTLYPKPVYPEGLFNCDACGHRGAGFSYHCSPCAIDLHTTCASLPLKFTHHSHHHPLTLTFSAPYAGNSFSCDLCKKLGSKTWIYSCATCEFDVHLTCVAAVVPPPSPTTQPQSHVVGIARSLLPTHQPSNRPPNVGAYGAYGQPPPPIAGQFGPNTYPAGGAPPQAYGNANQQVYGAARPVDGLGNQLARAAVEGIAQSASQALFQELFCAGGGGGGGGVVDVLGMDGGGVIIDGGSCNYGATDGGYSGEDGSY